jgi:hypothetical protein
MRSRLWLFLLVVPLAMATQVPVAMASDGWCDTDPILVIRTPAGRLVPVYVTVGAPSLLFTPNTLLSSVVLSYTAVPSGNGAATKVTVVVTVPSSPLVQSFSVKDTISTGPLGSGSIYASASGTSDKPMTSAFQLPYP